MRSFLLLSFCLVTCYGKYQDEDWIDPTDMLNYDAAAGRMRNQKQYPVGKITENEGAKYQDQDTCQTDHMDCGKGLETWKQKEPSDVASNEEAKEENTESTLQRYTEDLNRKQEIEKEKTHRSCNPIFRRYLNRILNEAKNLGFPGESEPAVHYDAEMVLTNEMIVEIQRFLRDADWNAGALDETVSRILVRFKHHNEEDWRWTLEDYIGIDPFSVFMISLSLLCIVRMVATELWTQVRWYVQIWRLFVITFVVSIGWNWMYLYKVAFAERQADIVKMANVDETCGKKMSWSENLFEWWKSSSSFQNDRCEEYYKALMVNPILLVPPTKALAVTVTNFITEPLKHIGKGLGEFFHGLLAEIPLFYQLPVIIIIAAIFMVFCYGAGTSIAQVRFLRRAPNELERLPPPQHQRPGDGHFIEGENRPANNRLHSNQQKNMEFPGYPLNPQPVSLGSMNHGDFTDHKSSVGSSCCCQQHQRKPFTLENSREQYVSDDSTVPQRSLGRQQRSNDLPYKSTHDQQPQEQHLAMKSQEKPQIQEKESLKDRKRPAEVPPVKQNCPVSVSTAVNPLPVVEVGQPADEVNESNDTFAKDFDSESPKELKQEDIGRKEHSAEPITLSSLQPTGYDSTDSDETEVDLYRSVNAEEESDSFIVIEKSQTETSLE
ncbi:chloride channel CLIC-like protein 1 [Hyperolius riggenbachi]|uniref:chloride channel CLIC-like protein 1 n=1 Tax=Hyperolius riggenbachi TaxID=752182 RepID=UPI0035A34FD5